MRQTKHVTLAAAFGIAVLSLVPIDWRSWDLAHGQTIADTLTDEERTIGTVVFTGDQIASLEKSMQGTYEALLTGQWQSNSGFEKYRLVVTELRKYSGSTESPDSLELVRRVQDGATDAVFIRNKMACGHVRQ